MFFFWFALRSIIMGLIGNSFYAWFKKTRMGVWFQAKLDRLLNHVAKKTDIESLQKKKDEESK